MGTVIRRPTLGVRLAGGASGRRDHRRFEQLVQPGEPSRRDRSSASRRTALVEPGQVPSQ